MKLSNEFKIGFWAIVSLVVLYLGVNYLKSVNTFKSGQKFYLSCDKVDGLAVSSHIKLHGMKIGTVRSMEYDSQSDRVIVLLNIYDNDLHIPVDSRFSVAADLLGTSDIVIEMGESTEYYENGATIIAPPAAPGLLDKADPIVSQLEQLMPKIDTLISGINVLVNDSKLQESLLEVNTLTVHLNQTVNEVNRLLRKDVPAVMGDMKDITANIDTLSSQLKDANIQDILVNANHTLNAANQLLTAMQSDDSSVGRLLNTTELHDQLMQTISDVESLISDIKANPKRYINVKVF